MFQDATNNNNVGQRPCSKILNKVFSILAYTRSSRQIKTGLKYNKINSPVQIPDKCAQMKMLVFYLFTYQVGVYMSGNVTECKTT